MDIIVQKYGGTSVADTACIQRVAQRIVRERQHGRAVVAVVSAQGHTTDQLLEKARELSPRPPQRELDMLLATGEQMSISLLAMAVDALGVPVISLTGAQGGIFTDEHHTKAKIKAIRTERIAQELQNGRVVIVAGFQGVSSGQDITTLGRGGSDTTAVALAASLGAKACEIYTDVEGVYTADPRLEPRARKLLEVGYGEMLEMASLGALVLQPRAVEVAAAYGVQIHVRSSFSDAEGTWVKEEAKMEKEILVTGVTADRNCAKIVMVDVPDDTSVLHQVFSRLAAVGVNVDMIVQTSKQQHTTDLTFTVTQEEVEQALDIIQGIPTAQDAAIVYDKEVAKVSIVGAGMMSNPGVAAAMFGCLNEAGIQVQLVSTSEIKVSCLIPRQRIQDAVQACHRQFQLEQLGTPQ